MGAADAFEIDQINIYQVSRVAMKRAVEALAVRPDFLLIDALRLDLVIHQQPLMMAMRDAGRLPPPPSSATKLLATNA